MFLKAVLLCWIGALLIPAVIPADVSLEWEISNPAGIVGYNVYYGVAPGAYRPAIQIGPQLTYTITGVPSGTWYFTVTSRDANGNESDYATARDNPEQHYVYKTIDEYSKCDLNRDGAVNAVDLQILSSSILNRTGIGDINGDGKADAIDLQLLSGVILRRTTCPK